MEAKRTLPKSARGAAGVTSIADGRGPQLAPAPVGADGHGADALARNPGTPLDLDVVRAQRVNRSAVERRAATLPARRTVKKEWQAAWLVKAIQCMDLTTLNSDDTEGRVRRLCAKG
ncbi:MAG: hypothetical protein ACXWZ4_19165, partial [Gemmatirosa sp.]